MHRSVDVVTSPDQSVEATVADYVRWHVVDQQQALMPDLAVIQGYGRTHAGYRGTWWSNGRKVRLLVRVSGDVAEHRAELRRLVAHPDLVDVEPSLQTDEEAKALAAHLRQAIPQTAGGVDDLNGPSIGGAGHVVPVWLEAGQTALAQRLYTTYGDRVGIRFGSLTYPINRARFRTSQHYYPQDQNSGPAPLTGPCGYAAPRGVPSAAGLTTVVQVIAPTEHGPSEPAGVVTVTNHSARDFYVADYETMVSIVDPRTGRVVGTPADPSFGNLRGPYRTPPRVTSQTGSTIGTEPCSYEHGYRLGSGRYDLVVDAGYFHDPSFRYDPSHPTSPPRTYLRVPVAVSYGGNGAIQIRTEPDTSDSVANYVRWDVVGQQRALAGDLDQLDRFRVAHPTANLHLTFWNGPMVQVFVQVEKGYENQVSDLVRAMPGHYPDEAVQQFPIMVGSYTTGVRHAEALARQLADHEVLPADAGRHPYVSDNHFVDVQLPATAAGRARAERLYATYGDQLVITVGQLTYPLAEPGS